MRLALALILTLSLTGTPALSQGKQVDKPTFSGIGRMEDWKASLPEFRAGQNSMRQKSWDDALNHFRASLDLYKYQPKVWIEIGRAIEAKNGNITEAEIAYKNATKLDTSNWHAWKRLANVLLIQKKFREAREAAASALSLNPPPKERAEVDRLIQSIDAGLGAQDDSARGGVNESQ